MKKIPAKHIRKILVTRTDRIGDVVLSTPVFQALRLAYPDSFIYALVLPNTADLLRGNPYIDRILVYDKRGVHRSLRETIRFARSLKREGIDIALHLHPTNRAHLISCIAGIRYRIGYKRKLSFLLTHAIPEKKHQGLKHEAEYNFDLLSLLNVPVPEKIAPYIAVSAETHTELQGLLRANGHEVKSPYVIMCPHASCPSKLWPPDYFAELATYLAQKHSFQIIFVGGKEAGDIVAAIKSKVDVPIINLAGLLSLHALAALFQGAAMVISNDSGPVHIAAALNVPVLSLFGRNNPGLSPTRWKPLGSKSFYLHKNVGCVECRAHNCIKDFLCLRELSVNEVIAFIEETMIPLCISQK